MTLSVYCITQGHRIAAALALELSTPEPADAWLAFAVQVRFETADGGPTSLGVRFNNPLNLTAPNPSYWLGQSGFYSGGSVTEHHDNFAAFDTVEHGAEAAAVNYARSGYYPEVIAAFRAGVDAVTLAQKIEQSPWSSDHYGGALSHAVVIELGATGAVSTLEQRVGALESTVVAMKAAYDPLLSRGSKLADLLEAAAKVLRT